MLNTSATNPLYIDEVTIPIYGGIIGMTICPGKKSIGISGVHERDLAMDLEVIKQWGAEILVSLLEDHEYSRVGVADFSRMVPTGILHLKLPIKDMATPDEAWEWQWKSDGRIIRSVLRRSGKVCIHCIGGLGRTGMIAARLLVEFGVHPDRAIRIVREARPGTIQTDEQEEYIRSFESVWRSIDRARACMLAGACGDALGATVEFVDRDKILTRFGSKGIRNFAENEYGSAGKITDDTQMSLFTADGLIRAEVRGKLRGLSSYEGCVHHAYLRWLDTQGEKVPIEDYQPDGWLIKNEELFHRRAPGITCLEALRAAEARGVPAHANNNSKGCGGVMRVAPVGIFSAARKGQETRVHDFAFRLGCNVAHLTHGHPSGYLSAGALSQIVADLVHGDSLQRATDRAIEVLQHESGSEETIAKLRSALDLAQSSRESVVCIEELGQGRTGEEALAIAVFCALRAASLEEGIIMAVNITGDSDSTGAIAGNLLGAIYGCSAIPSRWLKLLELRTTIQTVADDLLQVHDSVLPNFASPLDKNNRTELLEFELSFKESEWWMERYPGW